MRFLQKFKYEILLFALIQHLFIGIFLSDLGFYTRVIWPVNMMILGIASVGLFWETAHWKKTIQIFLLALVVALPVGLTFTNGGAQFMTVINAVYCLFYLYVLVEILRFLIRPGYINIDIITAAACGYFLLIEIMVFTMQFFYYQNGESMKGIAGVPGSGSPAAIYMDLVYFCSICITSIGFGDILPADHHTKLITALFGVAGQLYAVVLVGILISKFTAATDK